MSSDFGSAQVSRALFDACRALIPSGRQIAAVAVDEALAAFNNDPDLIKQHFSSLIADIQRDAYRIYLSLEATAAGQAIEAVIRPLISGHTADDVFSYLAANYDVLDKFSLSLTQSRRNRAGVSFEVAMSRMLTVLGYPFVAQPKLPGSNPDYLLPNMLRYQQYATDCVILTCKRTLRERWRQIVTEGSTGTTFFLATIDDKLSKRELVAMKDRNVVLVVPESLRLSKYASAYNVISFETFFLHYLDPALERWKASGVV